MQILFFKCPTYYEGSDNYNYCFTVAKDKKGVLVAFYRMNSVRYIVFSPDSINEYIFEDRGVKYLEGDSIICPCTIVCDFSK